jgi:hypothetical protein
MVIDGVESRTDWKKQQLDTSVNKTDFKKARRDRKKKKKRLKGNKAVEEINTAPV